MLTRHPMRLTVVMLPLMAGLAFGQGLTEYGAKAGLNLANIGGGDVKEDTNMKLGLALGGYATFDFGLPVLIRPEVMFAQKGFKIEESETVEGMTIGMTYDLKYTFGLNYLDINALAVYPVNDQIRVFAGPSFAPFLSGKSKTEVDISVEGEIDPILQAFIDVMEEPFPVEEDIESDEMNGMDIGFIIGAGYNLGAVNLEARYSLGLKQAYKEEYDPGIMKVKDVKNNVIQIIVGYGF